jgi:tetratricopeptide (TPR) repeat protein
MKKISLRYPILLHAAVLTAAVFAVFSNNYRHDYPLDCGHLLLENSYVRSLKFIPQYFVDGRTLTSLPANADYRPVLQVTYAINYAISGYDTWSWHLTQILLHLVCVLGLYFLCRRILQQFHPDSPLLERANVPLVSALLFAVHPTTSGVINYLSARSSLLVAAFLLPSIVLYMRPRHHDSPSVTPVAAAVLYALALFSKIEAIGALPVYFFYDVVVTSQRRAKDTAGTAAGDLWRDVAATLGTPTLKRLWPFLVVTGLYLLCYRHAMTGYQQAARHAADMTSAAYLFTQTTAWWHYVLTWFAPVQLVADDLVYPIFRSLFAPEVLLAIAGWVLVAGLTRWLYPRYAYLAFVALSALALISPTSSIMPLAEMVNEHRPYLPLAILSLAWTIPASLFAFRAGRSNTVARVSAVGGLTVLLAAFFLLTFQRNRVFATEEAYYSDIIKKAPSTRAYVNYGLTFMRRGQNDEALKYYRLALDLAPNWHIIHINLGIVYQQLGDWERARYHLDRAVQTEQYSAQSLVYRGEYFLKRRDYAAAQRDFEASIPLSREMFAIYKGVATAAAGLGNWRTSLDYVALCRALDPQQTELQIASISAPFWEMPDRYQAGLNFYQEIDQILPGRWWVAQNIGDLAAKLGNSTLADQSFAEAKRRQNAGK